MESSGATLSPEGRDAYDKTSSREIDGFCGDVLLVVLPPASGRAVLDSKAVDSSAGSTSNRSASDATVDAVFFRRRGAVSFSIRTVVLSTLESPRQPQAHLARELETVNQFDTTTKNK